MEQRSNDAAVKDAQNIAKGGMCRRNGAKVKLCNVGGCTNQTNLRKEFCVQEVLMERRSDYKAVKDAYKIKHGKEYAYAA